MVARGGNPRYTVATPRSSGDLVVLAAPDGPPLLALAHPRRIGGQTVPLVLLVVDEADDGWAQVALPTRPNGSTGWVRASGMAMRSHEYRIEVELDRFHLAVFLGRRQIFEAPVAVATDDAPTPGGMFYTTELLETPDPDGPYGPYAIGLSGHSEVLTSFNGGDGQLGIHGTNEPDKIGTKVSHGCIRLDNGAMTRLAKLGLPLGTPVFVS